MADHIYGFFGWREFRSERSRLLSRFDLAKQQNVSRPVRASHGNVGESAVREWLASFLPQRFAVTSGYIIPSVVRDDYSLRHFDVVIYDALDAPVLWIEDDSSSGSTETSRAIPAEYVRMVLEVKASLNLRSVKKATSKLAELNVLADYLPEGFAAGCVFYDIPEDQVANRSVFEPFNASDIFGHWGGLVLRSHVNPEVSGVYQVVAPPEQAQTADWPLVADPDLFQAEIIHVDGQPLLEMWGPTAIAAMASHPEGVWHIAKQHIAIVGRVCLTWGHDGFAEFAGMVLDQLRGVESRDRRRTFGAVFHRIPDSGRTAKTPGRRWVTPASSDRIGLQTHKS